MRLELDLRESEKAHPNTPKVLRIVVSVRNLLVMLAKLDDPTSARRIQNNDVRWYTGSLPKAWFYDAQRGWILELVGRIGPYDRLYWWHVTPAERVVRFFVTRAGVVALLGDGDEAIEPPRDYETSPWDRTAPLVICETDYFHYGQRPAGPGLMHPDHEAKAQELGAVPGEMGLSLVAWQDYLRLSEAIGIHPEEEGQAQRPIWPELQTEKEGHTHPVCPRCGAELCNGLIIDHAKRRQPDDPQSYAEHYGWPRVRCFSSVIGIEIRERCDGVSEWLYPCCGLKVDRFTREEVSDDSTS